MNKDVRDLQHLHRGLAGLLADDALRLVLAILIKTVHLDGNRDTRG